MGRATRWLKSILGGGRKSSGGPPPPPTTMTTKERRRWGFVRSMRERDRRPEPSTWSMDEEDEQSKRAIAVAKAAAAAAEVAIAAAKAAANAVRITTSAAAAAAKREESAAVKIQASFRGYLARRALRALRGLVKLQALVRGNIVRKQAAETLRCMQALVRVQARARSRRALLAEKHQPSLPPPAASSRRHHHDHSSPPTPEKFENPVTRRRRRHVPRPDRSGSLEWSSSRSASTGALVAPASSGWNWLDRWMEERYMYVDERSVKIVEIDTGKPQNRRVGGGGVRSSCSPATSDQKIRSFATVPADSPSSVGPLRKLEDDGCSDGNPSYMACTESSRAKSRSQSAPRQRPLEFEKSAASGKQQHMMAATAGMRVGFGSGRLDRLEMPTRI